MFTCQGYGAADATSALAPMSVSRRDVGETDVLIAIRYCGVCHSDIHTARNEWGRTFYPCVPGHEIVGEVVRVGAAVTRFSAGDRVGVGCMVDSCRTCRSCQEGQEQYCLSRNTGTYNSPDKRSGGYTMGGYSSHVVVDQDFVLRIPAGLNPARAAPLLCAGVTTYAPLKRWGAGPGKKVGVVGLGGLGHMAVKLACALGAEVTVITTSPEKEADARRLGATDVVLSGDASARAAREASLDLLIDTVSAEHDLGECLRLVRRDGVMVLLGAPDKSVFLNAFGLIAPRRILAGSLIGGISETQEMLDFCAENAVASDIELIGIEAVNEAYARVLKGDVKYRFVIDMASLPAAA